MREHGDSQNMTRTSFAGPLKALLNLYVSRRTDLGMTASMNTMTIPPRTGEDDVPSSPGTAATERPRLEWVDLVKSVSVLLVVLMHFVLILLSVTGSPVTEFWRGFIAVLEPLRMPTFFVVSGLLAAGAVKRPWSSSRRRTLGTSYLYVLWSAILFLTVIATAWSLPSEGIVRRFIGELLFPADGYWFLYALVLYFVIAKLARSWPAWIVVGLAATLSLFRTQTVDFVDSTLAPLHEPGMLSAVVLNLVFFLFGVYYKDIILKIADAARWHLVGAIGAVAVALSVMRFENIDTWANSFLLLSVLWITTGVMLARLLVTWETPRSFAAYLGVRTLPIFVIQFPLLQLTRVWLADSHPGVLDTTAGQVLYPLVATALVAAIGIGVYTAVQSTTLRYLFTAPDWVVSPPSVSRRPTSRDDTSKVPATQPAHSS